MKWLTWDKIIALWLAFFAVNIAAFCAGAQEVKKFEGGIQRIKGGVLCDTVEQVIKLADWSRDHPMANEFHWPDNPGCGRLVLQPPHNITGIPAQWEVAGSYENEVMTIVIIKFHLPPGILDNDVQYGYAIRSLHPAKAGIKA